MRIMRTAEKKPVSSLDAELELRPESKSESGSKCKCKSGFGSLLADRIIALTLAAAMLIWSAPLSFVTYAAGAEPEAAADAESAAAADADYKEGSGAEADTKLDEEAEAEPETSTGIRSAGKSVTAAAARSAGKSEASVTTRSAGKSENATETTQAFAAGQVVVLYEDDAFPAETIAALGEADDFDNAGEGSLRAQEEIAEGAQTEILSEALGSSYIIEETIVIDGSDGSDASGGSDETAESKGTDVSAESAEIRSESSAGNTLSASSGSDDSGEKTVTAANSSGEGDDPLVIGVISSDKYSAEEMAERLSGAEGIKIAEPDYIYTVSSIPDWNDTYIKDEWQLGDTGVNAGSAPAPAEESVEDPVVVAVMDTGIDYEHEDLAGRMWTEPETGYTLKGKHGVDFSSNDSDPMDENGHGTHCAGIIAAAADNAKGIAGAAGKSEAVRLMAVRVFDEDGSGYLTDIVKGFKYLIRARKEGVNVRAVNCSFGADTTSDLFDAVIEQAGQNGILTIVSAGNAGSSNDSANVSPANAKTDYTIVVASTDNDGSLSAYSNYGSKTVDIAAPGNNILSSVSYDNYAPYLYDASRLAKTTQTYGEFGGAVISKDESGRDAVTPVSGTAYNGASVSGVGSFGQSHMYTDLTSGSKGTASLSLTKEGGFSIGNNDTSLRWSIKNAKAGDSYILYFPYDKLKGYPDASMVYSSYSDGKAAGWITIGDVKVTDVDSAGNATWEVSGDETGYYSYVNESDNGIWNASGLSEALFDRSSIAGLEEGTYGLGFVYEALADGDIYVDISSLAVARRDADTDDFGRYDVYSGTSMAAPSVSAAAGVIAASDPDMDAETLKAAVLSAAARDSGLSGKVSTSGRLDFSEYSAAAASVKPSISSVTADFANKSIMIKGRGFTDGISITAYKNAASSAKSDGSISTAGSVQTENSNAAVGSAKSDSSANTADSAQTENSANTVIRRTEAGSANTENSSITAIRAQEAQYSFTIDSKDISVSGTNQITISDAGMDGYGLIGSSVRLELSTADGTGEGSFYIVKGLNSYKDEYTTMLEDDDEYWYWSSGEKKAGSGSSEKTDESSTAAVSGDSTAKADESSTAADGNNKSAKTAGDGSDDEEDDYSDLMPSGLKFVPGANKLLKYNSDGDIYQLKKKSGSLEIIQRGEMAYDALTEYADSVGSEFDYWVPDNSDEGLSYSLIGTPVYMDNKIYELIKVDMTDRDAYVIMGLNLYKSRDTWKVYYDSLTGLGSAPSELNFRKIDKATLAVYSGRLWLLGCGTNEKFDEDTGEYSIGATKEFFSVKPKAGGSTWRYEGSMPEARTNGRAIAQGGRLWYFLSNDSSGTIDYSIYCYDGSSWSKAGELPKVLFADTETITKIEDFWEVYYEGNDTVLCATGIDSKGIIFAGKSFDGPGDTFRFNTTTGKIEPLGYSLWQTISDRVVDGTAVGNKFYVEYENTNTSEVAGKSIKIGSGYTKRSTKVIMPKKKLTKKVGTCRIKAYTDGTVSAVKWKSSNSRYAKVNKNGSITFKKAGIGKTVTLTATSVENKKLKAKCRVKIIK